MKSAMRRIHWWYKKWKFPSLEKVVLFSPDLLRGGQVTSTWRSNVTKEAL
jgi:hypothetical protein